jgi:hypothetical protein
MTELFIEKKRADIDKGISALLTLSIDDVKDFGARSTSFSKTIVLPGTANNNKIFGSIFDVSQSNPYNDALPNVNINFNPAKRARCFIFQNNIQAFKGDLRLLNIIIDNGSIEYEVAVFGELYGLVAGIGRAKLEDLDFSAYDHNFNVTNIQNSWANYNAGAGYYYPLIDYGNYSVDKHNWNIGTFRPALFVKQYLEKIFANAGYTYDAPLFNTQRFKRLIVPHNKKILTAQNKTIFNRAGIAQSNNIDDVDFTIFLNSGSIGAFTTADDKFFNYTGTAVSASVTIVINVFSYTGTLPVQFSFIKSGVTQFTANVNNIGENSISGNVTLNANDTISLFISGITPLNVITLSATCMIVSDTAVPTPVAVGDTVKMNDTIPSNILQRDFLSSIMKLFNLYIYEDPEKERHVKISPYVDFYSNPETVNWSDKVDRSQPIRITPMAFLTSRFYDFKFKDDSDYYNELYKKRYNQTYGQYTLDSTFDFEDNRETLEVIFSPTPLVGYDGEDKVYSTILKLENNIESQTDSNIRILQALHVTGVTAWNITGQVSGLTSYGYAGHYDDPDAPSNDIHFGVPAELFFTVTSGNLSNHQFNVYHSSYMAEITDKDSRLLKCKMKLNITDIFNLDFSKLIWIDGALWRLVKIIDYNMSEPDVCEVELLKVIEKIY